MPFQRIPGFPAQIYVPDDDDHKEKKHDCADCYSCQWCSDERCQLCLRKKTKKGFSSGDSCGGCDAGPENTEK